MWAIGDSFAQDLQRSGISLQDAAEELGVSERQIKHYIAGDCRIPKLVTERVRELAQQRARRAPAQAERQTWFRFIGLFAGIGGLRIG
jgi:predicted transcriptional regulator